MNAPAITNQNILDKIKPLTDDTANLIYNVGGRPTAVTPEAFAIAAEEWKYITLNHMIRIETGKTDNKSSEMIVVNKPEPPVIESFLTFVGISTAAFGRYLHDPGFEAFREVARDIREFCNTQFLRYTALGLVSERFGIFYLVNNSRYQDKAEVVQTVQQANKPAWLAKDAGKLPDDDITDIEPI